MPVVVAVQLWYWMTNFENGVVNYVLTQLHVGDFINHDWYASPTSALGVTTSLIVWGAIPFVTITVYAGLSQVPRELLEAASIDGAGSWRSFLDVTFPILKPIFLILTSLSIIWDFSVFTQPFLLLNSRPNTDYYLMSIYLYEKSIGLHEYGLGSAIAIVMVLILLVLSAFYVRQMVRIGEVR
jgi:N,N'-diacetylchitobiose transport system permease protein